MPDPSGSRVISPYRVELQDDALDIYQAEIVDAPEDESAVAKAIGLLLAAPTYVTSLEVWQQDRCVFRLRSVARGEGKESAAGEEQPCRSCRVLVCDDNKDLLDIMRRFCIALGYSVRTVDRGWPFMAACVAAMPDCIVLDLNLPDINGMSLLRWLLDIRCGARIIVTTGTTDEAQLAKVASLAQRGLSIAILRKPFELAELVNLLKESGSQAMRTEQGRLAGE